MNGTEPAVSPVIANVVEVALVITDEVANSDPVKILFQRSDCEPRSEVRLTTGK